MAINIVYQICFVHVPDFSPAPHSHILLSLYEYFLNPFAIKNPPKKIKAIGKQMRKILIMINLYSSRRNNTR